MKLVTKNNFPPYNEADYIIFKEGDYVYAKNGRTGKIEFKGESGVDDANVTQNAINKGSKIFIKDDLNLTQKVNINKDDVIIEGNYVTISGEGFSIEGTNPYASGLVHDIMIRGITFTGTSTTDNAIFIKYATRITIERCHFVDFTSQIKIDNVYGMLIDNCWFDHPSEDAVYISTASTDKSTHIKITNSIFESWGRSAIYSEGGKVYISRCFLENANSSAQYGIYLESGDNGANDSIIENIRYYSTASEYPIYSKAWRVSMTKLNIDAKNYIYSEGKKCCNCR